MDSNDYQWHSDPPKENGDFFYNGPLPDGDENVIAIVQIATNPINGQRAACLLIPPGWRGDNTRLIPTVHYGMLDQWTGQWSGPEYGLCCAMA